MNARDANLVLQEAVNLSHHVYFLPTDAKERAAIAQSFARALDDVPLEAGLEAVRAFYRAEKGRAISVADILELLPASASVSDAGNVTELRLAAERQAVQS